MTRGNTPEPTRSEVFRAGVLELRPKPSPGDLVLLDEACRLIDRSDHFARMLGGDDAVWATIFQRGEHRPAELQISSLVTEARSTAAELRQIVKALALPTSATGAAGKPTPLQVLLGGKSG